MEPSHRRLIALLLALLAALVTVAAPAASAAPPRAGRATADAIPQTSAQGSRSPAAPAPGLAAVASGLSLVIDQVTPIIAGPTTDTTMTVTVTNSSGQAQNALTVSALTSGETFADRAALDTWTAATATLTGGRTLGATTIPALAAGARATVQVIIPKATHPAGAFGVLPIVVQVAGPSVTTPVQSRVPLPWLAARKEWVPIRLAWVAPVTLPADPALWTGTTTQVAAAWQSAIGPTSTIRTRLTASGAVPVTWLVDPSVTDVPTNRGGPIAPAPANATAPASATPSTSGASAPASTSPSPTASASATPSATAGTGTTVNPALAPLTGLAADLSAALKATPAAQVLGLPATDPDLAALSGLDLGTDAASLVRRAAWDTLDGAMARSVDRSLAWPVDGSWSASRRARWTALTGSQPQRALVASANLASTAQQTPTALGVLGDGSRVVTYDSGLSELAAERGSRSTAVVVQEFLAQTMALLAERPGTENRPYVVALPRSASVDAATLGALWSATASAPWITPTRLSDLTAGQPVPVTQATARTQVASPLTNPTIQAISTEQSALNSLSSILPASEGFEGSWRSAVVQTMSARWRGQRPAWQRLVTGTQTAINAATSGLQVAPTTINFLTDRGVIQLTVTNSLPYPVSNVRLTLTPVARKLRIDGTIPPISVRARSRTTIQVAVTATGAGTVPLQAQLSTGDGYLLGSQQTVSMNVRPTGSWIFLVAAAVAALVVIGGVIRSLRRSTPRAERELTQEELSLAGDPAAQPHAIPDPPITDRPSP